MNIETLTDASGEIEGRLAKPSLRYSKNRRMVLDVSDLIEWLKAFKAVSGIQRVDVELIRYALNTFGSGEIVYCIADGPSCLFYVEVPTGAFHSLLADLPEAHQFTMDEWRSLIFQRFNPLYLNELKLGVGDTLILPGAFWTYDNIHFLINKMKSAGVRLAVYIYDLIPLYQPMYCAADLIPKFVNSFNNMSFHPDVILTISEFVAKQVAQFYREAGRAPVPIIPVRLAQDVAEKHSLSVRPMRHPAIARLSQQPFVLCVGTIEIRKNHIYLFRIWQDLLEKYGPEKIPKLVWVGRKGWLVDNLISQLESTRFLDGHLVILHGLSDVELGQLYDSCLFTAFPSFCEGWGLPVGESFSHGKACVTSNVTSLPEVGGKQAVYCDPLNLRDGHEKIERLIFDSAYRQDLEKAIAAFTLRTWTDVGRDFFSQVQFAMPEDSRQAQSVPAHLLPYGRPVKITQTERNPLTGTYPQRQFQTPLEMYLVNGWHHSVELGGVWSNDKQATLRFALPLDSSSTDEEEFRIYFEFSTTPWQDGATLRIKCGATKVSKHNCPAGPFVIVLGCKGQIIDDRREFSIALTLEADIAPQPSEPRTLGIGIRSLGIARRKDLLARTSLLEQFGYHQI